MGPPVDPAITPQVSTPLNRAAAPSHDPISRFVDADPADFVFLPRMAAVLSAGGGAVTRRRRGRVRCLPSGAYG